MNRIPGYHAAIIPVGESIPALPGNWIVRLATVLAAMSISATFSTGRPAGPSE